MTDTSVHRILAGTDLTDESREVIPRSLQLAAQFEADLDIVHVVDADGAAHGDDRRRVAAERLSREVEEAAQPGQHPRFRLGDGVPGPYLNHALDDSGSDLVVIGFHRDHTLEGPELGSTMRTILTHTEKDVLMVSGEGEKPYGTALVTWDGEKDLGRAIDRARLFAPDAKILVLADVPVASRAEDMQERLAEAAKGKVPDEALLVLTGSLIANLREVVEAKGIDLLVVPTRGNQGGALGYLATEILAQRFCDTLCCQESVGA